MRVTQEQFIKRVAEAGDADVATVRETIDTMGDILFDYLSSATPSEDVSVKVWSGITFNSEFVPSHTIEYGIQEGTVCPDKIRVRAKVSRHYRDQLNIQEDEETDDGE